MRELKAARSELAQVKSRYARAAHRLDAIEQILGAQSAGIGQRIMDCREIAETLLVHAPEACRQDQGLVYRAGRALCLPHLSRHLPAPEREREGYP